MCPHTTFIALLLLFLLLFLLQSGYISNLPCYTIQQRLKQKQDTWLPDIPTILVIHLVLRAPYNRTNSSKLSSSFFPFHNNFIFIWEFCLICSCLFTIFSPVNKFFFVWVFFTCLGCNLIIFWVVLVNENVSKSSVWFDVQNEKMIKIDKFCWANTLQSASKSILIHNSSILSKHV